jgi:sulfoxide reductase heme-binding subunit YedZ
MTKWLQANWHWLAVTGVAAGIFINLFSQNPDPTLRSPVFTSPFEQGGRWALRFLLLSLAMSPLNSLLGWRWAVKFRKPLGLAAVAFAVLHVYMYVSDIFNQRTQYTVYLIEILSSTYIFLGATGITILALLAITSNQWAMRWLGKTWKALHRLVYVAGIAVTVHALWAMSFSKKPHIRGMWTVDELRLYLALMIALMVVRVPFIKNFLRRIIVRVMKWTTGMSPKRKNTLADEPA